MADESCSTTLTKSGSIQGSNSTKTKKKSKVKKKKVHKPIVEVKTKRNRALIAEIHVLNKQLRTIRKDDKLSSEEKASKISELEGKVNKLGGIDAYQTASKQGEIRCGNFNSAKWIVKQLEVHGVKRTAEEHDCTAKLLDVGALDYNYSKQKKWINCTAIDLNPQTSKISKADFLKMDTSQMFDVVVLSLVINYEGDAIKRGDMLKKCVELVKTDGYAFIVLPLPCLSNSRYFTKDLFISMMDSLGFILCVSHHSRKLSFTMFKNAGTAHPKSFPKQLLRSGDKHNNFSIII